MSKQSTTGMPKPAQPKPEDTASKSRLQPKLLHEYRSKHEREAEIQRLIILATAIVAGIAAVILVGAFLYQSLLVPNQVVANVNGQNINVAQFKTRAKIERALLIQQLDNAISLMQTVGYTDDQINQTITSQTPYSTWYGQLQVADQLGNSVLNTMVDDELVRQKAQELGITVSEDDVDAQINKTFGYDPATAGLDPTATPSPTVSPTPLVSPTPSQVPTTTPTPDMTAMAAITPSPSPFPSATPTNTPNPTERADNAKTQRDAFFTAIRNVTGVSDADIREYFRAAALREKVRDAMITDVGGTAPFVNARHILVADEATANTALQELQNGESFAELAKAISTDGSAQQGGELGWAAASGFVKEFADAVKTAEIGTLVGPIKTQYGYHLIQVRAREDREMSDSDIETARNTEFAQWLKDHRADAATNVQIYDAWTNNVPLEPQFSTGLF